MEMDPTIEELQAKLERAGEQLFVPKSLIRAYDGDWRASHNRCSHYVAIQATEDEASETLVLKRHHFFVRSEAEARRAYVQDCVPGMELVSLAKVQVVPESAKRGSPWK